MKNVVVITTFNETGYDVYGKIMLDTFDMYWPEHIKLVVYVENVQLLDEHKNNPRFIIRDSSSIDELTKFKDRHRDSPEANGYFNTLSEKNFRYDAVRFSHKVFALYDAIITNPVEADAVVWLDADTRTFEKIPDNFFDRFSDDIGIAFLGRKANYTECGFVYYNMKHKAMKLFWQDFGNMYIKDEIFSLSEWHDSYVFDCVRIKFEQSLLMKNENLTPYHTNNHPFINSILGDYLDHLKGQRKFMGRSGKSEKLVPSSSKYWS